MTSISSQVISLGDLLRTGDTYVVPPYQRNYAWEEDQYGAFWSDISNTFLGNTQDYFLGSVVLNNAQAPVLVVIDGQQRITTAAVLVSALRSHLRADGQTGYAAHLEQEYLARQDGSRQRSTPCLELNKNDKTFYDKYILSARPAAELYRLADDDTLSPSNRLIAECFRHMHRHIEELCANGHVLEELAEAIINSLNERVQIIRIDVKDDHNAFLLFETLNDRGLELSEADLLKNYLFAISAERLSEVQDSWDSMEQNLGSERLIKFMRHHWLSTHGPIGERGLYSDIKTQIHMPADAVLYADKLCEASECYAALTSMRHHIWSVFPHEQQPLVRELIETIEILRHEQIFIVLLAGLETDRRGFPELLRMLVMFVFRYTTICNLSPSNLLQPFINAAREIREQQRADAAALFAKYIAPLYPEDSQFHSAFSRKVVRSNAQARYILAKINDFMSPQLSMRTENDPCATTLEHILPKRYGAEWEACRKDFPGGIDKYVYRLGNMTLLAAKLNRDIGNAEFAIKQTVYKQDCLGITRKVLDVDKWTAEEIMNRQNWLASIACKIWRYSE
ncbi:MAG: DUF262 domain-containing HNH endonuclease family protein [Alphaproteobacteria bacterium]